MAHVDQDPNPARPADPTPAEAEGAGPPGGERRRLWLLVAVVAVVAVAVGGVLALGGDGEDDVATDAEPERDDAATTLPAEPGGTTVPGETGGPDAGGDASAATVAVVVGQGGAIDEAADLTLGFVGPDGSTVAERRWSEVADGASAGQAPAVGGLVQGVPAGDLVLRATLADASCEQPFTVAEGDRTILRVQLAALGVEADPMDAPIGAGGASSGAGGEPVDPEACAAVEPVDDWAAGRTGPTGEGYVGLAVADAESRATAAGLTTRVTGVDGVDLAVTMDLREDRLNLVTFDGVVVAAALDGEGGG